MSGNKPLYVALLLEPGADGLEGAISAAPTIVIHTVLHVVVIAVVPLDQVHLKNTQKDRSSSKYLAQDVSLPILKQERDFNMLNYMNI